MAEIDFWFDFASPYAWFASSRIDDLAARYGYTTRWRPVLMWVLVRQHGITPPLEIPARRAYFQTDMARSAAFFDMPYNPPPKLGAISTHLAARAFYHLDATDTGRAKTLARRLFHAYLSEGHDISDRATLAAVADLPEGVLAEALDGPTARAALESANAQAIATGVIGSPFFVIDNQGFFGADRLTQLEWHLARR